MKEAAAPALADQPFEHDRGLFRASPGVRTADARTIASKDLLRGRASVLIEHGGAVYQLRATSQGKLILTK